MINLLKCANFKCFKNTENIKIAPITILAGENNSGKTALIHAMNLPGLTLQSEDPSVCLRLLSKDYDLGSYTDVVYGHDERKTITLHYEAVT